MSNKIFLYILIFINIIILNSCNYKEKKNLKLEKEIQLGKLLFSDPIISKNQTQSCATCHNINHAFIDNRNNNFNKAFSLGDDGISFTNRNTPTLSYALFSPNFHFNNKSNSYIGGFFYDGRASDLKYQAKEPILNKKEMNIPSKEFLIKRLEKNPFYNKMFKDIYGENIFKNSNKTYEMLAQSISSFEKTKIFRPFDSKYDRYLKGKYNLTLLEDLGKSIFFSNNNNNCASCHMLKKPDSFKETFTNYKYHNIGTPKNDNTPNKKDFIDNGLLNNSLVKNEIYNGKMKVPTLRNIALTSPYMHNGVFKKLETVIKFYDKYVNKKRIINPETKKPWKNPEVYINKEDIKILKNAKQLNDRKIKALIAFMKLLTDKKYEYLLIDDN
jgi:cytochrome c peroxidase